MATKQTIVINIDGKADKAINATKKTGAAVSKLGNTLKNLAIAGGVLFAAKKGFELLGASIRKLTGFVKESINLAGVQEKAEKKLSAALKTAGIHAEGTAERLNEYAASLQKVTVYGDETIIGVEAMLATFGASEDVIKQATQVTLDMATAMEMDLKAAAILVGKAIAGETGSLSRYGIIVDEADLKTRGFAAVMDAMNEKFAGAAQAEAETYTGRMEQLKNVLGDMKEDVGNALLPTLTKLIEWFMTGKEVIDPFTGSVSNLASPFEKLQGYIKNATENMGEWIDLNWPNIISIAEETFGKIERFITIIKEADYSEIKKGVDNLRTAFGSLIGDEESGIEGAENKYQSFINSLGEGMTDLSKTVATTHALWTTVQGIMVGVVATWDTIWQGVLAWETFVESGFRDTSGFESFHQSLGELEQVSIMTYDNIVKAWEDQAKIMEKLSEESTSAAEKEFEGMEVKVTDIFHTIKESVSETQKAVDSLHGKDFTSTHTVNTILGSGLDMSGYLAAMGYNRQSGGILGRDEYIPDLGLFGKKGEAWIPASVVQAIKENRSSFAGLDASGGGGNITNTFNISELVVREEADIGKIAGELYDMQQTRGRLS